MAGRGGQSSYDVGCILFSNIKKQKKTCTLNLATKNKKQSANTNTVTKNKVSNIKQKQRQKQHTTYNIQHT